MIFSAEIKIYRNMFNDMLLYSIICKYMHFMLSYKKKKLTLKIFIPLCFTLFYSSF